MKVIALFVASFIVVGYGNPIVPEKNTRNHLVEDAEAIISETEVLQKEIKYLSNLRKEIERNFYNEGPKLDKTLKENSIVVSIKKELNYASLNGKNVEECQERFDTILLRVSESLKENYYDLVSYDLSDKEVSLMEFNGELEITRNDLTDNLKWHLSNCENKERLCNIQYYMNNNIEIEATLDAYKNELPSLMDDSIRNVIEEILPEGVKAFEEVKICLKNIH